MCDILALSADVNVAIADGIPNFLVDRPRRLSGRRCHGLPKITDQVVPEVPCMKGARPPLILCTIVRFGTDVFGKLESRNLWRNH